MSDEHKIVAPYTGAEYLESLRDDREVYIHGQRVKDVTTHPAFRNSARMLARWYDRLHASKDKIGVPTDTGSGSWTHPFFQGPKTAEHLLQSRDAIAETQRAAYGWMGRSPDYKASFIGTLGANADYYGEYAENARRWNRLAQERVVYWNHAIVNPPVDRHLPIEETGGVFIHVEKETDAGLIVSGAKVVATGSALTHASFVGHYGVPVKDKKFAVIFTAPTHSKGCKLISRASYELNAAVMGTPFDYPLSSRLDENDAILVFDKVLIPWENIFIYGDIEAANRFVPASGFVPRFLLHGVTRLAIKLDFIAGLFSKALEVSGVHTFRGPQTAVGEVIAWRNLFWGLSDAMVKSPVAWEGTEGYVQANPAYAAAYRVFAPTAYARIKQLIERHVASSLIYLPSSALDFESDEVRPYLDRFVRGSNGIVALDRVKLLKLLWDAMGSEFGGRHELYELNYAGNYEDIRIQTMMMSQACGELGAMQQIVADYMSEYDLSGWLAKDMVNPWDVNQLGKLVP
ncbi:4-hydroxyphenylacetate 3-monooxygenase oxygenase component [Lampropedia hyalina DSM 16112]|jgi:4-hydroxyphenylacetate 3-monooxygenase|uniref:4-hydroxyphenylacetate 3-monooxygenase oxygenase component n=1 Tax=Lampropedia hyalina DSM 16112 TaxID=1122156 RepID=A0A1M4Y7C3_9BURK|nr:4-hydroxyphenylacetate 3-hydroxylase N-terminal domain-containing protein [Lampropedia hyalina]SHF01516.1 4-hydroxyphenylacetate 3-monooxygenase oxygenase component [Lampropedia hyalina DSM 16112]